MILLVFLSLLSLSSAFSTSNYNNIILIKPSRHTSSSSSSLTIISSSTTTSLSRLSPDYNKNQIAMKTNNYDISILSSVKNTIGSSAKVLVSSSAMLLILFSSSWLPMFYIIGGISNAILSKVLKKILRLPRPVGSKKLGYGMPSSHAQSLFYFFTIISCISYYDIHNKYLSMLVILIFGTYASLASSWRVTSQLHTVNQTIVGCSLGITVGLSFFILENMLFTTKARNVVKIAAIEPFIKQLRPLFSGTVPLVLRSSLILIGALVLYSKEIKKILASKKQ